MLALLCKARSPPPRVASRRSHPTGSAVSSGAIRPRRNSRRTLMIAPCKESVMNAQESNTLFLLSYCSSCFVKATSCSLAFFPPSTPFIRVKAVWYSCHASLICCTACKCPLICNVMSVQHMCVGLQTGTAAWPLCVIIVGLQIGTAAWPCWYC